MFVDDVTINERELRNPISYWGTSRIELATVGICTLGAAAA